MLMKHMDKRKLLPTIQQQLRIIRQIDTLQLIEYDEVLFILSRRKIPIAKVQFYLHKQYEGQAPSAWRQISDSQIAKQFEKLKKDYTEKQWQYANACSPSKFKAKMAKYQKFQGSGVGQSKAAIKNRIKVLNDQIMVCLGNMNVVKQDNQYISQRERYNQLKQQLKYWQEKTKKIQQLNMENSILTGKKNFSQGKLELFDRIQEAFKLKQEKSLQKYREYHTMETVDRDAQVQRLRWIFDYYTKKNVKEAKLFQDIIKIVNKMGLQSYLKFIKQFQLNKILPFEQIAKIFKKKADSKRQIDFNKFCQTFQSIYTEECIKLKRQFIEKEFQQYLIHQIFPDSKLQKFLKIKIQKKRTASIGQNLASRIGQSAQQILQAYRLRRNLQSQKKKKNRYKNFKLQSFEDQMVTISNNQINRSSSLHQASHRSPNSSTISYSKKYAIQKASLSESLINRDKILKNGNYDAESNINSGIDLQKMSKHSLNLKMQAARNPELQQLRQLITEQQEDEYLSKHLLPPINHRQSERFGMGLNSKKFHF